MIFTGFKRKSNQIFFNKRSPDLLTKSAEFSSHEINQILVILDDVSKIDSVKKELNEIFKISKNNITIVVYKSKVNKEQDNDEVISPKDFGWYGKIKSEKLKTILTKKYDLLINYSEVDYLYTNLLILQSKVGFRVGFDHLDNQFYNLLINCKHSDYKAFNKELIKYLTILKKV